MLPNGAAVALCARLIYDGFIDYNRRFAAITARAARRFEQRDWKGQFHDIAERVELKKVFMKPASGTPSKRLPT